MKSSTNPKGGGRPKKFGEKAIFVSFRVPESKKEEIRKKVKEIINIYRK